MLLLVENLTVKLLLLLLHGHHHVSLLLLRLALEGCRGCLILPIIIHLTVLIWLLAHCILILRVSLLGVRVLASFHLEELGVHLLHLGNSLLVLFYVLGLFCIRCHFLAWLDFLHERGWVFPRLVNTIDSRRVNIVGKRRWVELLQSVF